MSFLFSICMAFKIFEIGNLGKRLKEGPECCWLWSNYLFTQCLEKQELNKYLNFKKREGSRNWKGMQHIQHFNLLTRDLIKRNIILLNENRKHRLASLKIKCLNTTIYIAECLYEMEFLQLCSLLSQPYYFLIHMNSDF